MSSILINKRGKTWQYRFQIASVNGQRKWASKCGFDTKKEALEAGTKALAEYNNSGVTFIPTEQSVSDYFDYWMQNYVKKELTDTTYKGYEKKIRLYIKPVIGKYKLKAVQPENLRTILVDMHSKGFSRNTLTCIRGIMTNAFGYASRTAKFISSDPSIGLKLPNQRADQRVQTRKKEKIITTPDMWNKIMERFPERHPAHLPLMIAYHTGMRLGEVFALTWDCINVDESTITINKQVQNINKTWIFTPPKYDSYRTISIDEVLKDLLHRTYLQQTKDKEYCGKYYAVNNMNYLNGKITKELHSVQLVNIRQDGTYIQPRITQHIGRVIHGYTPTDCISKEWDFHSLRHTHATMLLQSGVSFPAIQHRLGHAHIEMTEHYADHVTDVMERNLNTILGTLFT